MIRQAPSRATAISVAWILLLLAVACENAQPPMACGAMPQVTVNAGETAIVTACFNDPNGDMLNYSVASSNTSTATVSVAGATITVSGVAPGDASVTVTATDVGGLQGQQSFSVMVPNRAPRAQGTIPARTVAVGQNATVNLSLYFAEPDGEALRYSAMAADPTVATTSVSGSVLTVAAIAKGTTDVVVIATDPGGLTATQGFQVIVPNRAPEVVDDIPGQMVQAGETLSVDVSDYFTDPDGDLLTYEAASSDPATAGVMVDGQTVEVAGLSRGEAAITVTAGDPDGLTASQVFQVVVPNRAPEVAGVIPVQMVRAGESLPLDVSPYFTDPDGDLLAYEAVSSDPATASVTVDGQIIEVAGEVPGEAKITVTASDPAGLVASQGFQVTVGERVEPHVSLVSDTTVQVATAFEVELRLEMGNAPHVAGAVGVAISFDTTLVRYDGSRRPNAEHRWHSVRWPGLIRFVVSAPNGLAAPSTLITLPFRAVGSAGSQIRLDAGIVQVIASRSYADISPLLSTRGISIRIRP